MKTSYPTNVYFGIGTLFAWNYQKSDEKWKADFVLSKVISEEGKDNKYEKYTSHVVELDSEAFPMEKYNKAFVVLVGNPTHWSRKDENTGNYNNYNSCRVIFCSRLTKENSMMVKEAAKQALLKATGLSDE